VAFADRVRDPATWIPLAVALLGGGGLATSERLGRTTAEANSQTALIAMVHVQQAQAITYEARLSAMLDKGIKLGREMSCGTNQ